MSGPERFRRVGGGSGNFYGGSADSYSRRRKRRLTTLPFTSFLPVCRHMSLTGFTDDQLEAYLRFLDSENAYLLGVMDSLNAVRTPETRGRSRVRSPLPYPPLSPPPSPPLFRQRIQDRVLDSDEGEEDSDAWMDDSDDESDLDDVATVRYWSYPDLIPIDSDYDSDDDDAGTVIYPWEDPTVTP